MVSTKKSPTTFPGRIFAIRVRQQRSPGTLQTLIKISPNRGDIFNIKLRNTWMAIMKKLTNFF